MFVFVAAIAFVAACSSDSTDTSRATTAGTAGIDDGSGGGADPAAGTNASSGAAGAAGPASAELDLPSNSAELLPFLETGMYRDWQSEADFHVSSGPHGGQVRVYYSPKAAESLSAKRSAFPRGAATVKEATTDGVLSGWSVWVKVQNTSDEGNGFYWYEVVKQSPQNRVYADAIGSPVCTDCHSAGKDYLRSAGTFE